MELSRQTLEALPLEDLQEIATKTYGKTCGDKNRKRIIERLIKTAEGQDDVASAEVEDTWARVAQIAPPQIETPKKERKAKKASEPKQPKEPKVQATIDELQAKYLEVVGRSTGSMNRNYLRWKISQAVAGKVPTGPRTRKAPGDYQVLPVRVPKAAVEELDDAWKAMGRNSRQQFIIDALIDFCEKLGAPAAVAALRGE